MLGSVEAGGPLCKEAEAGQAPVGLGIDSEKKDCEDADTRSCSLPALGNVYLRVDQAIGNGFAWLGDTGLVVCAPSPMSRDSDCKTLVPEDPDMPHVSALHVPSEI